MPASTRGRGGGGASRSARDLRLETLADVLDAPSCGTQHVHRYDESPRRSRVPEEIRLTASSSTMDRGAQAGRRAGREGRPGDLRLDAHLAQRGRAARPGHSNLAALARAGARWPSRPTTGRAYRFLVTRRRSREREGLDPVVALEALTINPARMLGLDDRVGALVPGLDGDVVIWSGDPLDVMSRAEHVLIAGATVYEWDAAAGRGRTVERSEWFVAAAAAAAAGRGGRTRGRRASRPGQGWSRLDATRRHHARERIAMRERSGRPRPSPLASRSRPAGSLSNYGHGTGAEASPVGQGATAGSRGRRPPTARRASRPSRRRRRSGRAGRRPRPTARR